MRYADLALLLIPVGLAIAWLTGVRGLSRRGTGAALVLLLLVGGALAWLGHARGFTGPYRPAHWAGHAVVEPVER